MTMRRVKFGVEGLDAMLLGGLLERSICALVGTYGTGKTTFGLQFAYEGLRQGEKVIYISLEEREELLRATMAQKGWDTEAFSDRFYLLKLDPTDFNLAISSIKSELPALIKSTGASRVIIDPISLFEGLFEDASDRRREMFRLIEVMRDEDCTLALTSETDVANPDGSKYGLVEYLADTVILLRYIRSPGLTEVHLALEVVKMRRSAHSREIKPFEILQDQIMVYSEASLF
ncbi:KaiC domain-containing protein [Methanoculleus sp. YWC-01]|jgi:KaiC domain protein|uniref:KaiC domain-containing protein n=1 Tax=Methanoculleus nereidis TaxID=2735141 RepID=A0ABU3YZP0_9EURY|nr:KaiC domain-containing protein [Methanoculleus sp. YWC-01]MDV4342033.1 KaiC domain-containing protein [Methanoculleus sp. YWC-01]PKL56691.1 MAG: KaiC domain-containing protein [Methanomicrobiales archaeon HGW-Methanomicrobiales-6]